MKEIRFGILCTGFSLQAWQAETIKKLLAKSNLKLELLIFDVSQNATPPNTNSSQLFWKIYQRFYIKRKSKAFKIVNLSSTLKNATTISCKTEVDENGNQHFNPSDIKKVKDHQLDFILNFNYQKPNGDILDAAKFGVWTFDFGQSSLCNYSPPCFWEIYHQNLVTGAFLKKLSNDAGSEIILKQGFLKTEVAYAKNIDNIHFEASRWPLLLCADIENDHDEIFRNVTPISGENAQLKPSNAQMIKFFLTQFKLYLKKGYKTLFITDYWNIGVAMAPIQAFLDTDNLPEVKWFPKLPKNKFIADPFGIFYNDELHIIYEDFLFHERIGKTAALQFENNQFKDNGIVIDEPFHMSYPFVFEQEGAVYCIPETYQANQVRLYKALEFPKKWKLEKVLIDNYAGIDNTLFFHDGLWWMFSTDKNDGVHYNLKLHFADNVFGNWQPHPKNPVKTDIRCARPAGNIFVHNGEIFRPSMDYSEKVEGRIVINKILKLSKTDFKEEKFCIVNPYTDTFFSDKIHTLSQVGQFTIIDGAKELFVPGNIHALKYKLVSLLGKLTK